jgi:hypothetical protein
MFSFISSVKVKRVLFTGLVLVLLVCISGGCKNEAEDDNVNKPGSLPSGLVGKWVDYDSFEITAGTIKYDDGGYGFGYEGTIRFISNYDSKSGVIIVEYTTGAPLATKPFHAIYYLNLTGTTVSLNNTWDATDALYSADTDTLDAAKEKFTLASMGNWMDLGMAPTYTKQ